MTWNFADGFDCYNYTADASGYWDAAGSNFYGPGPGLPAGRFPGSTAMQWYGSGYFNKLNNGVNDGVHHFVMAVFPTNTLSGGGTCCYVTLYDGSTPQCTINFISNGNVVLTAGAVGGATLATYPGALTAVNAWVAFEFEVQIHNTLGSFSARKNGNTVNDFSATNLNTRATANNYANGIQIGLHSSAGYQEYMDDFYWRSGLSGVPWMGDLRCFTRAPKADVQAQFTPSGVRTITTGGSGGVVAQAGHPFFMPFVVPSSGQITGVAINYIGNPYIGNTKLAIYTDNVSNPGTPGTVLAIAANIVTNPPLGYVTHNIAPALNVTTGQLVWIGFCPDTDASYYTTNQGASGGWWGNNASNNYASFPVNNPVVTTSMGANFQSQVYIAPANSGAVNELPNDALTTYIYDANIGDNDLYSIKPITATPSLVLAVRTCGMMRKSDAGGRTATMQLNSNGTIVSAPNPTLSNTGWTWASRLDITDPNTGAAWTPSAVDALQIGPKVVA